MKVAEMIMLNTKLKPVPLSNEMQSCSVKKKKKKDAKSIVCFSFSKRFIYCIICLETDAKESTHNNISLMRECMKNVTSHRRVSG